MLRTKLLLFILSGALLFAACSDTSTDPGDDDGGGGEEPADPTATINNPGGGGEPLEGEVTFSVDGETENSFSEVRVLLDGEQIASAEDPSMPYETKIKTQTYNNGDYNLVAELDVSDPDTTVSDTVSVTLENYLVEVDTEGYIEYYVKNYNKYYLLISDPAGNILRSIDLTDHSGGIVKLLPPSMIDNEAPEHFAVTQAYTRNFDTRDDMYLDTFTGFESWTANLAGESFYSESGDSPSTKELTVEMGNFQKPYWRGYLSTDQGAGYYTNPAEDTLQTTIGYSTESGQLLATMIPYPSYQNNTPMFKREKNLGELSDPDTLRYDVANDFSPMVTTDISHSSDLTLNSYSYRMSVAADTWDDGEFWIGSIFGSDGNDSNTELGMYIPDKNHLYSTYLVFDDSNNEDITYYQNMNKMPSEFTKIDAQFNITNRSFDDMQFETTGSADYVELIARDYKQGSHLNYWWVFTSDSTTSFVLPHVADSLDQSMTANYSRDDLNLRTASLYNDSDFEGYGDFLSSFFGTIETENEYSRHKTINLQSNQSKAISPLRDRRNKHHIQSKKSEIPIHLKRRK